MTPQNTIAIVYDYDQTLSPSYMQEDVIFPAFGINGESFWRRCAELVREHGYDNELAYMKVMLDTFGMDRPTNAEGVEERKSKRLNSSHVANSYAFVCLKKKKYPLTK